MSIPRSASTSDLTEELVNINDTMTHIVLNQEACKDGSHCGNEKGDANRKEDSETNMDHFFTSKAQTLDRFSRPSSINHHGEKRKKSFFASFRLSKKSSGRGKEDQGSSGCDLRQTPEKMEMFGGIQSKTDSHNTDTADLRSNDDGSNIFPSKPRKHYLNRMSSFVNKVANRVQGSELNSGYGLRSKLERSQTVTGTDLMSTKVDYVVFDENQIPGLMGIRNHGNTCFINAVIQCLSHTNILAEYFVLDQYKSDLARCNRINSKKYGTRGEITEHLAILLKSLWVLRYVPDISLNLKNIVEKYEPCYRGSNQHDAAEFLMFVLDKVHEDLNTASKRKYKKVKSSYGRPDEIVAAETLANHLRCNSSFIQDIFQAQFRSSLKCPHCLKESNTFDPYLCVSIPIPQKEVLSIFVTVVYLNQQPKQVKIGVTIEASSSLKQLRSLISADCGICLDQLILTEIDGEGFHRTFSDNACVNIIKSTDPIYAIEFTPRNTSMPDNGGFIDITWMNVLVAAPSNIRFGGVYQTQMARDVTYPDLQKLLLKEMATITTVDTLIAEQENGIFGIGVDNGTSDIAPLEPDLDHPLLHQSVDDSLAICHPMAGPPHIKLVLHWTPENKEKYIMDDVDHIEEHSSVEDLKRRPPECPPVTLSDCLQLHTSAEMLSCGDAWHCPTCNRKQQVLKRLNLWSAPQVLVIHLKRFKQVSLSSNSSKLNTIVNFPLSGFDISDHMAGRHLGSTSPSNTDTTVPSKVLGGVWSPWKKPKKFNVSDNDHVYDLFAICNHHGRNLLGGHYTAVCRNPTNGKWYTFDDFNIEETSQEQVAAGQDAYILFYQRREDPSSPPFTQDSELRHWSYRIPLSALPSPLKIIPNEEDKKGTIANEVIDTPPITEPPKLESSPPDIDSGCDESPLQLSPASEIIMPAREKPTSPIPPVKEVTEKEESMLNVEKAMAVVNGSDPEAEKTSPPRMIVPVDAVSPVTTIRQKKLNEIDVTALVTSIEPPLSNGLLNGDANHFGEVCCNGTEEDEENVPDVRIQPASLEVLASHRVRSCPASQSVINVMLRPKSQGSIPFSGRPGSLDGLEKCDVTPKIDKESSSVKITNGYCSENGSSCDEETPEVRIGNAFACSTASGQPVASYRKSISNKTPSFVIIRTPTSSPRSSRDKASTPNGAAMTRTNGNWKTKGRDSYMSPSGNGIANKDKRPLSYAGGPSGRPGTSINGKRIPRAAEKISNIRPNGHYEKTKSISCVRECEKKENYNHYLTESSV